ncbi:response regulator transcription factor [Niallia oryzisoli]|uniref:response regulator transcription factor n=1 Tax=Niallia oryzisoli TaxID=1737571 RepID=UPI0037352CC8
MKQILIIGKEENTSKLLTFFKSRRFFFFKASSMQETLSFLEKNWIDLVLISNPFPGFKNKSIIEKIRKLSQVPIMIILNSRKKSDLIQSLRNGADVCLTQPINKDELLARVNAVLRNNRKFIHNIIQFNGLIWREDSFDLKYFDCHIPLAPKEFKILGFFLNHPDKVITHCELVKAIWGEKAAISERTVHSYIRNIRYKLKLAGFPIELHLMTVWGIGYRWDNQGLTTVDPFRRKKVEIGRS